MLMIKLIGNCFMVRKNDSTKRVRLNFLTMKSTAKTKLERLQFSTSSSFVKV